MSTYKEIRGKLVKRVTIDPTPATNHEGEMWYNTTTGALKVAQGVASAWSSGPTSSSPAVGGMVGVGAQTAAVLAGGLNILINKRIFIIDKLYYHTILHFLTDPLLA